MADLIPAQESQPRPSSGRWYWCIGCGRWHDPLLPRETHFLMYWTYQPPNPQNFEGTADDLARFLAHRQLAIEDVEAMERRVDERLKAHDPT